MSALHRPYLAVMTPALVAYLLVKDNFVVQTLLYELITLSALAAACVGVIRHRPPRPRLWWFVIGGAGLTAVGDAVWAALRLVWHNDATPSLADIPYLASYPLIGAGLLVLIRSRTASRDRAGLLDATIVAAGLFVLSWAFLIAPTAGGSDLTVLQRLATAAYPVGDLLLLALVARLVTTPGARTRAYWLLVCALLASLLANAGYAVESVVLGRDTTLALFDLGWVLFPVLLGAAALHPSMAVLSEPAPDSERRLGRGRLMLLASASLLAPGTQLLQVALGREINAVAIGLGSAVLFVLVLLRVAGLLERVRSQAVQLAALARDDALTGLPNRRTWDFELTRAFAQAGAQGDTLAVGLLDLDHFKAYNDSHGHQAGDRLLTAASAAWRALLPPGVVLARYGGDEFGLLLPGHDLAAAAGVLDQLVAAVPEGQTLSVGVAGWDDEEDPAALVARADAALYRAKRDGRDRVAVDRGPGRAAAGRVPAPRGETVEPFSDVTST